MACGLEGDNNTSGVRLLSGLSRALGQRQPWRTPRSGRLELVQSRASYASRLTSNSGQSIPYDYTQFHSGSNAFLPVTSSLYKLDRRVPLISPLSCPVPAARENSPWTRWRPYPLRLSAFHSNRYHKMATQNLGTSCNVGDLTSNLLFPRYRARSPEYSMVYMMMPIPPELLPL